MSNFNYSQHLLPKMFVFSGLWKRTRRVERRPRLFSTLSVKWPRVASKSCWQRSCCRRCGAVFGQQASMPGYSTVQACKFHSSHHLSIRFVVCNMNFMLFSPIFFFMLRFSPAFLSLWLLLLFTWTRSSKLHCVWTRLPPGPHFLLYYCWFFLLYSTDSDKNNKVPALSYEAATGKSDEVVEADVKEGRDQKQGSTCRQLSWIGFV